MRKTLWTLEKIANGFEKFKAEKCRYPTAVEIDECSYLPSSRQIQRRFSGGLPELRKKLKLDGPMDFSKGEYSSERARTIGRRAHKIEKEVYDYLIERFGKPFVHREYFFTDDRRTRTDFLVYCKNGNFCVDVFYPKDKKNLIGCLNSKMRTYGYAEMLEFPVIFLMMNEQISKEEISGLLKRKKNGLRRGQLVMRFGELKEYCAKKVPL